VSCPKTAQSACKVALKLTVVEKLKGGKVVAVAASAKPRARTRTIIIGSTTVTVAPGKSKTADVGLRASDLVFEGECLVSSKLGVCSMRPRSVNGFGRCLES
jgi:hypothetical protein